MNKVELVKAVAEKLGTSQKAAKEFLDVTQEVVFATMPTEEVKLFDGVTLSAKAVPEQMRRNPQTGGEVLSPAHNKPVCKFGKAAKDAVNA